jgi:hypothetical protein
MNIKKQTLSDPDTISIGKITSRATGILDFSPGTERQLLIDALEEKYVGHRFDS